MSKIKNRKKNYWRESPEQFAQFYSQVIHFSSPLRIVAVFLKARTRLLSDMIKNKKNGKLLDLGCGSGVHLIQFAPLFKKVVGVDHSSRMLDIAKKELKKLPIKNWELIKADAVNLPFRSNQFDVVVAMGLLDYVKSPQKVLYEARRVLKKNGFIIFSMPKSPSIFGFLRTKPGLIVRKFLFQLPAIDNTVNYTELTKLLSESGFKSQKIISVWTAMWMVKAKVSSVSNKISKD